MIRLLHYAVAVLLLFAFSPNNLIAQCPSGDVNLYSQAQVDAFVSSFPSCTAISGNLYIGPDPSDGLPTDINDLSGLVVQTIAGGLNIESNPALPNLNGLGALTSINGRLDVTNNDGLSDIDVFNNIFVGLHVTASGNDGLLGISGFNNLSTMRRVSIFDNSSLTSISGLSNLDALFDLSIMNNDMLTDVSGFTYVSIGGLNVEGNASLSICNVSGFCDVVFDGGIPNLFASNLPGCNSTAEVLSSCLSGLPVELVEFKVYQHDLGHVLEWATASERNNLGFSIEHSLDGKNWKSIDFVNGHLESFERIEYRYEHSDAGPGMHYYRLQQIDIDGTFAYSAVEQNFIGIGFKESYINAYPNPSGGLLNLVINNPNSKKGNLTLATVQGQTIYEVQFQEGELTDGWLKQFTNLTPGMYVIQLQLGQSITWEKFQVIDYK